MKILITLLILAGLIIFEVPTLGFAGFGVGAWLLNTNLPK